MANQMNALPLMVASTKTQNAVKIIATTPLARARIAVMVSKEVPQEKTRSGKLATTRK